MRSKVLLLVAILVSGAILTLGSTVIARKSPLPEPCLGRLQQVRRGLPLSFLTLEPSVSLCEPVDRLSVVWEGNTYHKESIVAVAVDFVFWGGLSAVGLLGLRRYRQLR
jgi:hypothetical protein